MRTVLRRLAKAAVVVGIGAIVAGWFRQRAGEPEDAEGPGQARWPPLDGPGTAPAAASTDATALGSQVIDEPSDGSAAPAPRGAWVDPEPDGSCPLSHPVKVKLRSGIYHVPDGAAYERTNADRCYPDTASAEADGYRASKT